MRIKLSIGNIQSMEFLGLEGDIGYGETAVKAFSQLAHFSTTDIIRPGLWTIVQVTINPVAAKDVRFIRISGVKFASAKGSSR